MRRENGRFLIQYYRSTIDSVIKIFNGLKKKKNIIKKIQVKDSRRQLEDGARTLKVFLNANVHECWDRTVTDTGRKGCWERQSGLKGGASQPRKGTLKIILIFIRSAEGRKVAIDHKKMVGSGTEPFQPRVAWREMNDTGILNEQNPQTTPPGKVSSPREAGLTTPKETAFCGTPEGSFFHLSFPTLAFKRNSLKEAVLWSGWLIIVSYSAPRWGRENQFYIPHICIKSS